MSTQGKLKNLVISYNLLFFTWLWDRISRADLSTLILLQRKNHAFGQENCF